MTKLVENVKGIKKLYIKENYIKELVNSLYIGIYGPNGSGKSSFKDAIIKELSQIKKHFELKNEEIYIDPIIKFNGNKAIFDEIMVKLIKGCKL